MKSSCANRDARHAVFAKLRFWGRCSEVGSLIVADAAERSSRADGLLQRLAFGRSRVTVSVFIVFEDQVLDLCLLRLLFSLPTFVDLSCKQLVGELFHQLVFLLAFSVNGNDGCTSNLVFNFWSNRRSTRNKFDFAQSSSDKWTHLGSSSPSATSTAALAKSVFESSESCSSGVRISISIWDSMDSLSMTWWLNLVPELLRNIAIGVLKIEVDGLRGSKFIRFLKSPCFEGCATGGDLFTCWNEKETKGENKIEIVKSSFSIFRRTCSKTTSLTPLSLSCMLLVVSLVTRFPILLRFVFTNWLKFFDVDLIDGGWNNELLPST